MGAPLERRSITDSREPKFITKGTELSFELVPETRSRFGISEIGIVERGSILDRIYAVRDAETVTDAEAKRGIRPRIVGSFATLDEALAFVDSEMLK